ncbi:MAG: polysaccharide biosynthesis protein [Blastocatellia bacterium]|nr:polysaccharide biosynthesis protein [Blastocatellia bacterium]
MLKRESFSDRLWLLRRPVQFLTDIAVLTAAFLLAYSPTINFRVGDQHFDQALNQLPFVVLIQISILFLAGGYSIIWRYISISDIRVFLSAALGSGGILLALRFLLVYTDLGRWQVPISVIVISTVFAFGGMLAVRVLRRFLYELGDSKRVPRGRGRVKRKPALLVGAGRMGATLIKEMAGRADAELEIRGLVDDDARKTGGRVSGVKVLGTTVDLERLIEELKIKQVVIAIDHAQGKEIRRIVDLCTTMSVKTQIVPSLNEIAHGRVSVSRIRDVQIEDLLGREPVELDDKNLAEFLQGKVVMVTGGGGSIGSELVRQIKNFDPSLLLLVERAEYALFKIERELATEHPDVRFLPLIADVNDESRMREIFDTHKPDVIFHAAAHKHVPLMESNAAEAVKNNILATRSLGELAGEFGVKDFVLISTDKAVNPTSVMGASKRIAEIVVQELDAKYATKYVAVRFGNVLGSTGSVVTVFREQIRKGGPVTVTDAEMTRYFMTIPEASQLVLQAGALGTGGEIFVLDMGSPVSIIDLAADMIRLSGLVPYEDIDIEFSGIRSGEKLFEELEIHGEVLEKTRHPKIYIGKIAAYPEAEVREMLSSFTDAVAAGEGEIRRLFNQYLPEAKVNEVPDQALSVGSVSSSRFVTKRPKLGLAEK